nr:hypothetical protein [Candidatus Woesearchaeota archaeon]
MVSPLQNALDFLVAFGFFDVILPFIFVFTIMFAILEKTKIFGKDEVKSKNINAMIALVTAFFVIVTPKVVKSIQVSLPQVALVLVVIVAFLMLAGSFMADEEFSFKDSGWRVFLTLVVFFGIVAIFLNSVDWLEPIIKYITEKWTDTFIVSLIFLGLIIGIIFFVVGSGKNKGGK